MLQDRLYVLFCKAGQQEGKGSRKFQYGSRKFGAGADQGAVVIAVDTEFSTNRRECSQRKPFGVESS